VVGHDVPVVIALASGAATAQARASQVKRLHASQRPLNDTKDFKRMSNWEGQANPRPLKIDAWATAPDPR
jgi:hypothetical protein